MDQADMMANEMLRAVGAPAVRPVYPGQVGDAMNVRPVYPGQVGMPAGMVPQLGGQQVEYSEAAYPLGDVTYLGFGTTAIGAGLTVLVPVDTERPFTPQKMGCPSTIINLLILQVLISGTNILANQQGIPIEMFSEVSTFPQIKWPSLDTATGVSFSVQNPTGGSLNFRGCFYGTQVRR